MSVSARDSRSSGLDIDPARQLLVEPERDGLVALEPEAVVEVQNAGIGLDQRLDVDAGRMLGERFAQALDELFAVTLVAECGRDEKLLDEQYEPRLLLERIA